MWDESLPAYTGSFSDNVILFTLYFKVFVYYLIIILGVLTAIIVSFLPILGLVFSYKSIVIKFKKDKKYKHRHKKLKKHNDSEQNKYIDILDRTIKKKKHK